MDVACTTRLVHADSVVTIDHGAYQGVGATLRGGGGGGGGIIPYQRFLSAAVHSFHAEQLMRKLLVLSFSSQKPRSFGLAPRITTLDRSNEITVLKGFVNTIDLDQNQ